MIKLIASDLDDTLLNLDSKISAENKEAVRKVLAKGLTFTLATGRMFQSSTPFARELGLDPNQPIICYNGALIKRISGEVLYHKPLPVDLAIKITEYVQARGWTLNLYYEDELYVAAMNKQVEDYAQVAQVDVHVEPDLVTFIQDGKKDLSKILVISDPQFVSSRMEEIRNLVGTETQVLQSQAKYIEITNREAHKGAALMWLAQSMGLTAQEILALGDGNNDQSMLEIAGIGVAVANALPSVKKVADYETKSNYEHGVAHALNRFILTE